MLSVGKNNGIVLHYYVENSYETIIPHDLYMQVQEEIVWRANLHSGAKKKKRVLNMGMLRIRIRFIK